ncbi:MAG: HPr(Ser) kinase/phosphatase [Calditrichia bacterium]
METPILTVEKLYKDNRKRLNLKLISSEAGYDRVITLSELHRPGLALAGFIELFSYNRVQVLGNTEMRYLKSLNAEKKQKALQKVFEFEIPCIFVTDSNRIPTQLIVLANEKKICVFRTNYSTTAFSHLLSDYLQSHFAPRKTIHGTLVDVYGIGLLFTGRSGIGKSEISLDLVERGHRLVADDVVVVTKKSEEILMGEPVELATHHLEIRGLGIIDVRSIFGIRAVRIHKRLEVEVKLVEYDPKADYDRLGLEEKSTKILDVKIPQVTLPINPGKNITVIAETIALNHLMKLYGHHTPREFVERLQAKMKKQEKEHLKELVKRDYIEKDYE